MTLDFDLDELKMLKREVEQRIKTIEKMFPWTNSINVVENLETSLLRAKKTLNKITNMIQVLEIAEGDNANSPDNM